MNILNQALFLKDGATFSKVKKLIILARNYQKENDELFLYAKPRDVVKILDEEIFFKFFVTCQYRVLIYFHSVDFQGRREQPVILKSTIPLFSVLLMRVKSLRCPEMLLNQ